MRSGRSWIRACVAPTCPAAPRRSSTTLAELFHGFPDWQWRRIQLVVEDDRIAAHLRASGTHTGVFRGIAPTRRHVNVAEFVFSRVQRGRITEVSGTTDRVELLAQLVA